MPRRPSSSPSSEYSQAELLFEASLDEAQTFASEPAQPQATRCFLPWERAVLDNAVELLAKGYQGGELSLADTLVIVPTAESGRRLRQALARHAALFKGAAVAPHIWPPERALLAPADRAMLASPLQSLLAWAQVVGAARLDSLASLFPHPPERQDRAWCLATAAMLQELATALGAGGQSFASVVALSIAGEDMERWRDLTKLERAYHQLLKQQGLADAQALKAARAAAPFLPEGIQRVCLIAAPDLPPLLTRWIEAVAQRLPVLVAVQAPESLAAAFDAYGRPQSSFWQQLSALPEPLSETQIHLAHNATHQAERLVELLADLASGGQTALGVCDAEVTARVKEKLALEEVHAFEPGGVPPPSLGLWHVLQGFRDLIGTRSWRAFATLLRTPEVRAALAGQEGSGTALLRACDDLGQRAMPVTLEHAIELLPRPLPDQEPKPAQLRLEVALRTASEVADSFEKLTLPEAMRGLLLRLYGERVFAPTAPQDRSHLELADAVLEMAESLHREALRFGFKLPGAEAFALMLERVGQGSVTEPRGDVDLVLQGWLELLWEAAPRIIVAGLNEENVPGILISHPFLPDALRERLGLPSQASRLARDAYLLHALAAARGSQLQVICGQWSERGDALRPSRLLFRCADADLPARVAHLFPQDESPLQQAEPPRRLAWQLTPPKPKQESLRSISASRLRDYLQCPFRYYLTHGLGMSAIDPGKRELAANDFGDLIHLAMERYAGEAALAACDDEQQIADFLEDSARRVAHGRYGRRLPMLVQLQLESAVQRLRAAAAIEAQSRAEGWRIAQAEVLLGDDADTQPLLIEGVRFRGKIDRIEHRHSGGRVDVRVLDFKTSDKADPPIKAHLKEIKGRARLREQDQWKSFANAEGKTLQWLDLQLPLYAAALAQRGITGVSLGYFLLPKSIQDTTIALWPDFDATFQDAALACASEAVQRIQQASFWPPASVKFDAYEELFLGDPLSTVQPPG